MKRRNGSNTPIMLALLAVVVFSLGYLSMQRGCREGAVRHGNRSRNTGYRFRGKNYDSIDEYNEARQLVINQYNNERADNRAKLELNAPTKSASIPDRVSWISDYLKNNKLFGLNADS